MNNLTLKKLRIYGNGKEDACLSFTDGLNVITGPSNTGKSFAFQTIKYLLGSDQKPKEGLDEAEGYQFAQLEIFINQISVTIERSLKGGNVRLYLATIEDILNFDVEFQDIKSRPPNKNNLSQQLLNFIELDDIEIIRGIKNGAKGAAHLSDFRKLMFTDEENIMSEISPFLTGDQNNKTRERSLLNYILTGEDYKNLILENIPKAKTGIQVKINYIEELVKEDINRRERLEARLKGKKVDTSLHGKEIQKTIENLRSVKLEIDKKLNEIKSHKELLQKQKSQVTALTELQARFYLLSDQYSVDIDRLNHLLEVNDIFSDLKPVHCPYCNQAIEDDSHGLIEDYKSSKQYEAITKEIQKTKKLLSDLKKSLGDIKEELNSKINESAETGVSILNLNNDLKDAEVKLLTFNKCLNALREFENDIYQISFLNDRIMKLSEKKNAFNKALKETRGSEKDIKVGEILKIQEKSIKRYEELCTSYFKKLKFHNDNQVKFIEEKLDITIGLKPKVSFGKGYRSIANSIMNLAIFNFCVPLKTIPGLMVLDSPLTTYEGEKRLEKNKIIISKDMQDNFFTLFRNNSKSVQIIIFENESPCSTISSGINIIEFTGNQYIGRYGLFPAL